MGTGGGVVTTDAIVLYYTCQSHREEIELACRANLRRVAGAMPIVHVSRGRPRWGRFGDVEVVVDLPRSPETLHRQLVAGLEAAAVRHAADNTVFMCENDVLYHSSHFWFRPTDRETFFYNTNVWHVRWPDGHAVRTDDCKQLSGCVAPLGLLLEHFRRKLDLIEREGRFHQWMGFEPGSHVPPRGVDTYGRDGWQSLYPNLDIRHDKNVTKSKWHPSEYRNQKYAQGWQETDGWIPGWGTGRGALVMAGVV